MENVTNHYHLTDHANMPAKKAATKKVAKKVAKKATKKVVKKKEVQHFVKEFKREVPDTPAPQVQNKNQTWAMKKPRSWADWSARQIDNNKIQ